MQNSRLKTFVGFAIKKRAVLIGVDNVTTAKRKIKIILADETLSERSAGMISRYASDHDIPCYIMDLEPILPGRSCKAIGITDSGLADAIKSELKES